MAMVSCGTTRMAYTPAKMDTKPNKTYKKNNNVKHFKCVLLTYVYD
jgi:hypothetical protein